MADVTPSPYIQDSKLGDGSRAAETSITMQGSLFDGLLEDHQGASRLRSSETTAAIYQLSPGELAGIIVAAVIVTAAVIGIGIWLHFRRKKSKSAVLSAEMNSIPSVPQISIISMETDLKNKPASRQNSSNGGGYNGPMAGYRLTDEMLDAEEGMTEYGSVMGSFPPSPALSFRSALDAPGFSRSRAGTGTSFGTVASYSSRRSRLSGTASFHTCVEEEFH